MSKFTKNYDQILDEYLNNLLNDSYINQQLNPFTHEIN